MKRPHRLPVVLLPACGRTIGDLPFQVIGEKYLRAVQLAGCTPLVLPSLDGVDADAVLDLVDGVLLTGSPSNIAPHHFGQDNLAPGLPLDPGRDAQTLPLVRQAIERGLPLLAICRGLQELNVALGGTLHQAVHDTAGRQDHRAADTLPPPDAYAPAHRVQVQPGGALAALLGVETLEVNSLHGQAVDRPGAGLRVEALSDDGVIEALSLPGAAAFTVGVQWHPEWQAEHNPVSRQLLRAFGDACRAFRDKPRVPEPSESLRAR